MSFELIDGDKNETVGKFATLVAASEAAKHIRYYEILHDNRFVRAGISPVGPRDTVILNSTETLGAGKTVYFEPSAHESPLLTRVYHPVDIEHADATMTRRATNALYGGIALMLAGAFVAGFVLISWIGQVGP